MKRIISSILAVNVALMGWAQMDNVVDVETTYQPTVQDAKKIDVLPQAETTTIKHYDVEYSLSPMPTNQYVFQPAGATVSDVATEGAPKGFFTLAGGNNSNLLARGAYGWDFTPKTSLNFDLGTRGHIADVDIWHQRFYSTKGMVKLEHRLTNQSSVILRADGESQVYNYQHQQGSGDFDKQHNWIGGIDLSLTPYTTGILSVGGHARYNMFSRRCLLTNTTWLKDDDKFNQTEHKWDLGLTTDLRVGETIKVGVDLNYQNVGWSDSGYMSVYAFDVIPHFTIDSEKTYLRLGARLTFEEGTELEYEFSDYHAKSKFKVAPDVYAAFHVSDNVDIFGQATGGVVMNDFRQFQSMTPYWLLPYSQLPSAYNNVSALLGFKWKIQEGLFTKIYAGFDDTKNRAELMLPVGKLYQNQLMVADGSLIHVNAEVAYNYKDMVSVKAKGRFNGWGIDENNGYFLDNAVWRPTVEASAEAIYQPVNGLRIGVDYQFATYSDDSALPYKRPSMSNLGASVSYRLPLSNLRNNISIYAKVDNILGSDYDIYYGQKAPGTSVLAGFALDF